MRFYSPTSRHYAFVGLARLSLLLAILVTIFWALERDSIRVRSLFSTTPATPPASYPVRSFSALLGGEGLVLQYHRADKPPVWLGQWLVARGGWSTARIQPGAHWLGLHWATLSDVGSDQSGNEWNFGTLSFLVIPLPFFSVILLILPIYRICCWLGYGDRWRWKEAGFCAKCGYDLRASKERCPECGTAVPTLSLSKTG